MDDKRELEKKGKEEETFFLEKANQIYSRERERNNEISRKVSPRLPVLIALRESASLSGKGLPLIYTPKWKSCKISRKRMDGPPELRCFRDLPGRIKKNVRKKGKKLYSRRLFQSRRRNIEWRLIDGGLKAKAVLLTPQRQ